MVLFNYFAEVTGGCVSCLVTRESLLRKMQFNPIVIPLSIAVTALLNLGITFVAMLVFAFSNGVWPMWTWIELPVIVLVITMLAVGPACCSARCTCATATCSRSGRSSARCLFYGSSVLYVGTYVDRRSARRGS